MWWRSSASIPCAERFDGDTKRLRAFRLGQVGSRPDFGRLVSAKLLKGNGLSERNVPPNLVIPAVPAEFS